MKKVKNAFSYLLESIMEESIEIYQKYEIILPEKEDNEKIWRILKDFSKISFKINDKENDAFLYQWGKIFYNNKFLYYYLNITRQFIIHSKSEYGYMIQISCDFRYYEYKGILEQEDGNIWSYDFGSFEDFWNHVEKTESFITLFKNNHPYCIVIDQCDV